jgi:leucyl-tRNA synthetase
MSETGGIESKWRRRWRESGIFENDPVDGKPKYFLTIPYPYASGALHVGHARSYTLGDVSARYKRMRGYNVLFPMASHITGTPILAISKKIEQKDESAVKGNREYVSFYVNDADEVDRILGGFDNPENVADFYANAIRADFEAMGYAIDWRRFFTTGDRSYNAFIRWQYQKLKEKGYVMKGHHAVYYCPNCANPVTTDDIKSGDEYEIGMNEFHLIKMPFEEGFLVAATLRPETIFGVVNTWVNPDEKYVKARVDEQIWYVADRFAQKYREQMHEVDVIESFNGADLAGKTVSVPLAWRDVQILAAEFVDVEIATGVVNSVPAHAPYDYIAGLEAEKKHNISLTPIPLIKVDGYGDIPAKDLVEREGIESQSDFEKLERITAELYKDEFYRGVMNENCKQLKGVRVQDAKDKVAVMLADKDLLGKAYEKNIKGKDGKPVLEPVCRCGTPVVIRVLSDQWFLNYANEGWKEKARQALSNCSIEPEMFRRGFEHTIVWLHEWPCTRNRGLGTKLPFDERWMIESLSDSTIYMAYYTIAHRIKEKEIREEQLSVAFFDYVLLGEGSLEEVSEKTGIESSILEGMRAEFLYWYPMDERRTGTAHISNHLTFMLFHHSAIFEKNHWPKKISLNEMLIAEGRKMSKSLGNVIPIHKSLEEYGADVVRLYLIYAADPENTLDWRDTQAENTKRRLRQFQDHIEKIAESKEEGDDFSHIDIWLKSKINNRITEANTALDASNARKAIQSCLYEMLSDINWYMRRTEKANPKVMRELADKWVRLMTPFTPYACEELWEKLGEKSLVSEQNYPIPEPGEECNEAQAMEEYISGVLTDIKNITQVIKKDIKKIHIYISEDWKYKAFESLLDGKTIKDIMQDPSMKQHGKDAAKIMQTRKDQLPKTVLPREKELKTIMDARGFLEKELHLKVEVHDNAQYDPEGKSRFAQPMKPGIYME